MHFTWNSCKILFFCQANTAVTNQRLYSDWGPMHANLLHNRGSWVQKRSDAFRMRFSNVFSDPFFGRVSLYPHHNRAQWLWDPRFVFLACTLRQTSNQAFFWASAMCITLAVLRLRASMCSCCIRSLSSFLASFAVIPDVIVFFYISIISNRLIQLDRHCFVWAECLLHADKSPLIRTLYVGLADIDNKAIIV